MNNATPEVGALKKLMVHVIDGGIILFDDYAYAGYEYQRLSINKACTELGIPSPISLPTGQGVCIKY